jgi:hypothetical protein
VCTHYSLKLAQFWLHFALRSLLQKDTELTLERREELARIARQADAYSAEELGSILT